MARKTAGGVSGAGMKRKYSGFTLRDALQLLKVERFTPWNIPAPDRPPSPHLYIVDELPRLLGALNYVCAECSRRVTSN